MTIREVTFAWGDKEHIFKLGFEQLAEVETEAGGYLSETFGKLLRGEVKVGLVRSIIRLGLIGGGMAAVDALKLVGRHFGETSLLDETWAASRILGVAVSGRDLGPRPSDEVDPEASSEEAAA